MREHCKINIQGKVQGVFFRKNTLITALKLNIRGWVRNEADGSVSIDAAGDAEDLKNFLAWCHKGPENAFVKHVVIENVNQPSKFNDFQIVK